MAAHAADKGLAGSAARAAQELVATGAIASRAAPLTRGAAVAAGIGTSQRVADELERRQQGRERR